jgi:hypothetical protein
MTKYLYVKLHYLNVNNKYIFIINMIQAVLKMIT